MEKEVEVLSGKLQGELAVSVKKEVRVQAEEGFRWAVVIRMSNGKSVNAPALVAAMEKAWNTKPNVSFQEMADNRVVVKLRCEEEQSRAVEGGPWTFMGWAVIVEKWRKGTTTSNYNSWSLRIWVQVHNVPVEYRDRVVPRELAELAGKVIKDETQDKNKDSRRRKHPRFRIEIDVTKPIMHGVYLMENEPVWIAFKYERLPIVCLRCGWLTHSTNQCEFKMEEPPNKRYGANLRAEARVNEETAVGAMEEEQQLDGNVTGGKDHHYGGSTSGGSQKEPDDSRVLDTTNSCPVLENYMTDISGKPKVGLFAEMSDVGGKQSLDISEASGLRSLNMLESLGFVGREERDNVGLASGLGHVGSVNGPSFQTDMVTKWLGLSMGREPSMSRPSKLCSRRGKMMDSGDGRQGSAEKKRFHPYDGTRCVSKVGLVCDSLQGGTEAETDEIVSAKAVAQPRREP
ncbi:unnamed protein product [Rhodiola kirilowii]